MSSDHPSRWFDDPDVMLEGLRGLRDTAADRPTIAGYHDVIPLRRGGQGMVFSGVRTSTGQRVAIKVLMTDVAQSEQARLRFEREIDLACRLNHPHLVRMDDRGVTEDGRLFCVMEYIDGIPLDEHLAHLGIPSSRAMVMQLAEMFIGITEAVAYAHRRGVIHRDLKPSNIRVDRDDVPHVLDFGLAKLETPHVTDQPTTSRLGEFLGSVPWASPEQVNGDPDDIDVRTDVYALGILLYCAMTGEFPYRIDGPMAGVLHRILNDPPPAPRSLNPALDDEIETIILACLEKDPDRRYRSAGALAADLARYRDGRPLEARAESTWYTLRTTMRRHRPVVAMAALSLVAIVIGLAVSLVFWNRAVGDRQQATLERDRAAAVSAFLHETLASADPSRVGAQVTVLDLLMNAADRLETEFPDEPRIRGSLHLTLGTSLANIGYRPIGTTHLAKAERLLREHAPESDPERLHAIRSLALSLPVRDDDRAIAMLREVHDVLTRTVGRESPETLRHEGNLGLRLIYAGHAEEGLAMLTKTESDALRTMDPGDFLTHELQHRLISGHHVVGNYDEAERLAFRLLECVADVEDPDYRWRLSAHITLSNIYRETERPAEALEHITPAVEVQRRVLGEAHPAVLNSMRLQGRIHQEMGDLDAAEELIRAGLNLASSHGLGETQDAQALLFAFGEVIADRGNRPQEVIDIATKHRRIALINSGEGHPRTFLSELLRGTAIHQSGRPDEGLVIITEAARSLAATMNPQTPNVARWRRAIEDACNRIGRPDLMAELLGEPLRTP